MGSPDESSTAMQQRRTSQGFHLGSKRASKLVHACGRNLRRSFLLNSKREDADHVPEKPDDENDRHDFPKHDSVLEEEMYRMLENNMTLEDFNASAISSQLDAFLAEMHGAGPHRAVDGGFDSIAELVRSRAALDRRQAQKRENALGLEAEHNNEQLSKSQSRLSAFSSSVVSPGLSRRYFTRPMTRSSIQSNVFEESASPTRSRRSFFDPRRATLGSPSAERESFQTGISVRDIKTARSDPRGAALDNHAHHLLDYRPSQHTETAVHRNSYTPRVRSWLSPYPTIESPTAAASSPPSLSRGMNTQSRQAAVSPMSSRSPRPKQESAKEAPRAVERASEMVVRSGNMKSSRETLPTTTDARSKKSTTEPANDGARAEPTVQSTRIVKRTKIIIQPIKDVETSETSETIVDVEPQTPKQPRTPVQTRRSVKRSKIATQPIWDAKPSRTSMTVNPPKPTQQQSPARRDVTSTTPARDMKPATTSMRLVEEEPQKTFAPPTKDLKPTIRDEKPTKATTRPVRDSGLNRPAPKPARDVKPDKAIPQTTPARQPPPSTLEKLDMGKSTETVQSRWSISTTDQRPTRTLRPLSTVLNRDPRRESFGNRMRSFGSRAQTTMIKVLKGPDPPYMERQRQELKGKGPAVKEPMMSSDGPRKY